jgi:hypothetical protein
MGINTSNAKKYEKELMKLAGSVGDKIIMPLIRNAVADLVKESAVFTPHNTGALRSAWTATVNASGRLSSNDDVDNIRSVAFRNLRKAQLTDIIAIENQVPHAETYEYGLFKPATPKYEKYGGSEARHVVRSKRAEKLGKVLIVSGFNVTAPSGMVHDAMQMINAGLASGTYRLGTF